MAEAADEACPRPPAAVAAVRAGEENVEDIVDRLRDVHVCHASSL